MQIFRNFRKFTLQDWTVSLAIFLGGAVLLIASHQLLDSHPIIQSCVEAIVKVSMLILPLDYLRERLNHHQDVEFMKAAILGEFDAKMEVMTTRTEKSMSKLVEDYFPKHQRLQEQGPADMLPYFDPFKLIDELSKVQNSQVRILKIYLPLSSQLLEALREAIVINGNKVLILLADPQAIEALHKRADATNTTTRDIQRCIYGNIDAFVQLYYSLPDEHKSKLTVKLHRSFIATSFVGYDGVIWEGTYLSGRLSTDGSQKKFLSSTRYYRELSNHFDAEWNGKHTKIVDLANWWARPNNLLKHTRGKRNKSKRPEDGEIEGAS